MVIPCEPDENKYIWFSKNDTEFNKIVMNSFVEQIGVPGHVYECRLPPVLLQSNATNGRFRVPALRAKAALNHGRLPMQAARPLHGTAQNNAGTNAPQYPTNAEKRPFPPSPGESPDNPPMHAGKPPTPHPPLRENSEK